MTMTPDERETLRAFASGNYARGMILAKTVEALCNVALREDQARTAQLPSRAEKPA